MKEYFTFEEIDLAARTVQKKLHYKPRVGLILGSGLGDMADTIEKPDVIPFKEIPNWPEATAPGHVGRLVVGKLENQEVLVLQGRLHYYEGYSMAEVTLPIRVMQRLGIEILVLTNAAGGVNPNFSAGDVMLITDHIGMVTMTGLNPLRGPNLEQFGVRFPDVSQVYDRKLQELARKAAKESGTPMQEGVYVNLSGPSFETPADLRFLRTIGADAVGMSTVPEAIVAVHGKTRVLGLSGISNKASLDGSTVTTGEEVLEAGKVLVPKMERIIRGFLRNLA
ncbi:MAG: purine-nucleoside phosphorylase [Leptolinea sp.]|jgi:purine-nucleoside phosphorylase|nr:purine-nucleoside phosphorylase [Leptolinea sp.]